MMKNGVGLYFRTSHPEFWKDPVKGQILAADAR